MKFRLPSIYILFTVNILSAFNSLKQLSLSIQKLSKYLQMVTRCYSDDKSFGFIILCLLKINVFISWKIAHGKDKLITSVESLNWLFAAPHNVQDRLFCRTNGGLQFE